MISHRKDKSFPDIVGLEIPHDNFENFDLDFQGADTRVVGLS